MAHEIFISSRPAINTLQIYIKLNETVQRKAIAATRLSTEIVLLCVQCAFKIETYACVVTACGEALPDARHLHNSLTDTRVYQSLVRCSEKMFRF